MPPCTAYNPRIPSLYTVTEVSIRRQNKREVGIRRIPAYTPNTPLMTVYSHALLYLAEVRPPRNLAPPDIVGWLRATACVVTYNSVGF